MPSKVTSKAEQSQLMTRKQTENKIVIANQILKSVD